MAYPIYNKRDIMFSEMDGDYYVSDFTAFISQLLEQELFENDVERGVTAYVNTNGTSSLSEKQAKVLDIIISRHAGKECMICGEKISFREILDYEDNGRLCSYHKNAMDKD